MRARARPRRLGFAPAGARLSPCRKLCRRKRTISNTRPSIPSRPNSLLLHHLDGPRAGPAGREAADTEHRAGPLQGGTGVPSARFRCIADLPQPTCKRASPTRTSGDGDSGMATVLALFGYPVGEQSPQGGTTVRAAYYNERGEIGNL